MDEYDNCKLGVKSLPNQVRHSDHNVISDNLISEGDKCHVSVKHVRQTQVRLTIQQCWISAFVIIIIIPVEF